MDSRDLAAALRDVLGPVTIDDLTRLSGGASRETWSFDAVGAGGSRTGLVLRRDKPRTRGLRETIAALEQAALGR